MIRLVPLNEKTNVDQSKRNRAYITDDFFAVGRDCGCIFDSELIGFYARYTSEKQCMLQVQILNVSKEYRSLAYLTENTIRKYHPTSIVLNSNYDIHTLHANGYYQKGKLYQKKIEPWRLELKDQDFDSEGYLINQGDMKEIPFGWFNTRDKGCGWIAAYNLMKMMGKDRTMQEVAEGVGKCSILGGLIGQDFYLLFYYLRKQKIACHLSLTFDASAIHCIEHSRYGILLYSHRQGAHYVAYRRLENGKLHFYNAVYGATQLEETIQVFLKKRALLPFSSVIYVK